MQIIEKEKLLLTTKHRLDDQIASQQKLFMLLKKNTQQWTQYVNAKKAKQEEENKCIAKQLKHKKVQQQKRLLAVHEIKYVIPEAITLAKLELSRQYTAEKGTVHLKNIIESLNTNKS
ncbi:MAG: hypothetical protein H6679_03465 [Epsilonproteobacteria bacterium]|nr:hypothetical protein [Campylobacterota bacterium]